MLQRYGESADRPRCFYQQRSYGGGREGQSAESQAVGVMRKKLSEKISTGGAMPLCLMDLSDIYTIDLFIFTKNLVLKVCQYQIIFVYLQS